ncbi:MAG: hypothetical protein QOH71_1764 [Blastocatellia bacterium]|jgi:hypothetical protein|nr:hypothetical protein [Blastocatellia bacterium]
MFLKRIAASLFPTVLILASAVIAPAQDAASQSATPPPTPDAQQQQEEKLKLETKATALLDQLVTEAQGLKLPENRIRVHIAAGDMLWDRNAARARGLLTDAGVILSQMMIDFDPTDRGEVQNLNQLRQDLVLTAGRHDAELGYQLLRSTQPPTNVTNPGIARRPGLDQQNNLEQSLLAIIAANDPKVAYQKAVESLDKGEYPTALSSVLSQLQTKDPESFKKLSDKTLSRLSSDNIMTARGAATLAMMLLLPGPRAANASTASPANANAANSGNGVSAAVLSESAYHDLMDNAITAGLSVTSLGPGGARGGGGGGRIRGVQPAQQNPPDETQVRQNNARIMLFSLQAMLPQIDQYLPERAQAVRQKLTELGMGNAGNINFGNQMRVAMEQGTSESLAAAASTAPTQMQPRLYQQAARKAVDEGNPDRALQIANDHLDESSRNSIMQAVDFKRIATNASAEKLTEIKQKLAALPSDSDRVKYLIDLSTATQKDNPKLALRFLDDARNLVSKRVTSYKEFEDQIKVADAFGSLDPKRSFELLELGIGQLNELLSAAAVLNGFEVEMYKEGELSLRANNDLVAMVARYGQELATLAKIDFEHARMTADRFQMTEPRLNAKLSIVQNILGVQPLTNSNNRRGQNNFQFVMR